MSYKVVFATLVMYGYLQAAPRPCVHVDHVRVARELKGVTPHEGAKLAVHIDMELDDTSDGCNRGLTRIQYRQCMHSSRERYSVTNLADHRLVGKETRVPASN